jgi:Protein kinase domain/zinc-ribbon domain/Gram-negative bacterial TonB protein C-terminal/PEGA domain
MYCSRCGTQNDDASKFCRSCGLDLAATPLQGAPELSEIELVRHELKAEYEIVEELGRGGMAIVFRARERQLDRDVAIKVLPFSLAFDKEFVERFQREARTAAKLEHPNIIPIYRVGRSGRAIYFVMKFLRGKSLSAVLAARHTLPPGEIRQVLVQVARALAYAHKSGIVHRDIKPDNIMFDEHGQAVVTDFGIAKAASGSRLTGTGMSIGTPHYMSPEQARAQALDGRSDIYSLGVVAYQCLSGAVPYDGDDSFSIGYKHIMEEVPTPPLDSAEQRELFGVVRKMMAKTPDDRFQSAEALIAVLEGAGGFSAVTLASAPTRAIPSLGGARPGGAPTTPVPRPTPRPAAEPKHPVITTLFLWLLIVGSIVGGGAFYAYRRGWLLASPPVIPPGLAASGPGVDSGGLVGDSGRPPAAATGAGSTAGGATPPETDTSHARLPPAGTPGKLRLQGIPAGARVVLNGQPVKAKQLDIPPGIYTLAVRAPGYDPFERQVVITPGAASTVRVDMTVAGSGAQGGEEGAGPCDQYGPAYNQDNLCFDTRPVPLSQTYIPVPVDAPVIPREAILLCHVSRSGETLEARIFVRSNVEPFNDQALDVAKTLRWNPAQKNGEPVDAWVQWPFKPRPAGR